jgi:hypothetical protein
MAVVGLLYQYYEDYPPRRGWAGHVRMGEMRTAYKILTGNLKGRDNLERPTRMWDVKMDLKGIGSEVVDWIKLTRKRIQDYFNTVP